MSAVACVTSADCDFNFECDYTKLQCVHEGLWPPNIIDVIVYIVIPIVVGVGNVGGLGGGVVKVPLLMLILNYTSKEATFLSYCILFGSCLANSTLLLFKKHPYISRPLIDFDVALIINPMVLLGTNLGIYLNIALPEIAQGVLFIIFLSFVSPFLYKKAQTLRRKKKDNTRKETAINNVNAEENCIIGLQGISVEEKEK